jgi:hypothetical protein
VPEYLDLADYLLIAETVLGFPDPPSVDETVATMEGVAAGRISEQELAEWLSRTRA